MIYNKTNSELLLDLDNSVYGHTDAKKALISLVNRSKIRHTQKYGDYLPDEYLVSPMKCLLVGGSGTGKTFLINSLKELATFPIVHIDATQFNPTGAGGGVKAEQLERIIFKNAKNYVRSHGGRSSDLRQAVDQTVVFVDEFDKISTHYEGSSGNWNRQIQTHFLRLFENTSYLSSVSWIFAGAFSGIYEDKDNKKHMGFKTNDVADEVPKVLTDEDLIKYGLLPEIMGRINSICMLDRLTEKDFYKILVERLIPKKMFEMTYFGVVNSGLEEEDLARISRDAVKSGQGVRYLQRELNRHFLAAEFNYEAFKYE